MRPCYLIFDFVWLVRKFEKVGSVQDKPRKETPHTATTTGMLEANGGGHFQHLL